MIQILNTLFTVIKFESVDIPKLIINFLLLRVCEFNIIKIVGKMIHSVVNYE